MLWKGRELKTAGQIMDIVMKIHDREEAHEFINLYEAENPHARENIGYMTGYYSPEQADEICNLFDVSHPIFGTTHPTLEDAFRTGCRLGEMRKNGMSATQAMDVLKREKLDWYVGALEADDRKAIMDIINHNLGE